MKNINLFNLCEFNLPTNIEIEAEGNDESQQYFMSDINDQGGVLSVKRMQWTVADADKREQMLASVYAETDREELAANVYWGLEELLGEEDGEKVAITRWLVTSLKHAPQFDLLIFNYSASVSDETQSQTNEEIMLFEDAIKNTAWL